MKVRLEFRDTKHGTFTTLVVIHTDDLPLCCACGEPITDETFVFWCKENPDQFFHVDCFTQDHKKNYVGRCHHDYYGIIKKDIAKEDGLL